MTAIPDGFDLSRLRPIMLGPKDDPSKQYPPTEEQNIIRYAARYTSDNIIVQALAGAAKTSTLELVASELTGQPILCVAFNKRIAEEMAKRLPSHCVCKTLNSIGHTAWGQFTGKRLSLAKGKMGDILKSFSFSARERDEISELWGEIIKLSSRAKLYGYVPEGRFDEAVHLVSREALEEVFADEEYSDWAWKLLDTMLTESIKQAYNGLIDFDDQLYMSTLFGAQLPRFPVVLADEVQDLSPLNHYMLTRLVTKRLIAVGDEYQSIYGFRGAVSDSMSVLRQRFQMKEYRLSVSFRCPKAVVRMARKRAPYMQWSDFAIEGEIIDLAGWQVPDRAGDTSGRTIVKPSTWGADLFPPGCAVICRNNAPLFSLGLKLLRSGRSVTVRGMDISKRLIKIMTEFGDLDMPQSQALEYVESWKRGKLSEGKLHAETIEDRYACLRIFCEATPTLRSAIAHAEALFAAEGPIELLSGHKSKGLEWDHVFHLDPWRCPSRYAVGPEAEAQEANLEYVITTRAKKTLTLLNLENFDLEAGS